MEAQLPVESATIQLRTIVILAAADGGAVLLAGRLGITYVTMTQKSSALLRTLKDE